MLFKVFTTTNFADEPDRCGVIEAKSLHNAVERLLRWSLEDCDWGDYEPVNEPLPDFKDEPLITYERDGTVTVAYRVREMGTGEIGEDVYFIRPVGDDALMFLAEDWKSVFA